MVQRKFLTILWLERMEMIFLTIFSHAMLYMAQTFFPDESNKNK